MTRKEALKILKECCDKGFNRTTYTYDEYVTARDMAIKALEQEPEHLVNESGDLVKDLVKDTISRQTVLSKIKEVCFSEEWLQFRVDNGSNGQRDFLINYIKQLPPVNSQEPKWIPVSERLPIAGEYVGDVAKYYLVQNEYGDMLVARYTHSEYWEQIYQMKPIADEIVAWMPLPEPYKAESEDEE